MAAAFQADAFQTDAFQGATAAAAQNYAAFSTPQLDGRTIIRMVAYLLMASACDGQIILELFGY